MKDTLFSPLLVEKVNASLARGEQAILFQNRRGFAPLIECKSCGWVPHCVNCDVSLTYHKYHNQLVCHYCGYTIQLPPHCPECQSTELKMMGFGTEKVEEEISFPVPFGEGRTVGFRYGAYPYGLRTHHFRLRERKDANPYRNADAVERVGFRKCQCCWNPECR